MRPIWLIRWLFFMALAGSALAKLSGAAPVMEGMTKYGIATHVTHGEPAIAPAVILALCWAAMVYQKPYLFWGSNASN